MTGLTLFPDQLEVKREAYQSLRKNQATLIQACTGFGKSALAADFCIDAIKNNKTVTVNVPRVELAKQLGNTMRKYKIPHGYISSKLPQNVFAPIQIATTDSLANRLDNVVVSDLLINDECHVGADSLTKIVDHWKLRGKKQFGLSATPQRMDGKGMDCWFEDMVCGPQMRWLIDNGRLNRYKIVVSDEILQAFEQRGASDDELDRVMFGDAVKCYKEHAYGLRAVAFCRSIKHAEDVATHFNGNGIPSASISSKTKDNDMLRIVIKFANREILVLTNCAIATFGWDLSQLTGMDATVECVILLRFTDSLPLYMQIVGRMLRVGPHISIMIDHSGCIAKHGLPCEERHWTLDGKLKKNGAGSEKTMAVRQCPIGEGGCGFVHRPSDRCPNCGRVYPVRSLEVETVDATMVVVDPEQYKSVKKEERKLQGRAQTYEDLLALERAKGAAEYWADKVWTGRGNSKNGLRERRKKWYLLNGRRAR